MGQDDGTGDGEKEDRQESIHETAEYDHETKKIDCGRRRNAFEEEQFLVFRICLEIALFPAYPGDPCAVDQAHGRGHKTEYSL